MSASKGETSWKDEIRTAIDSSKEQAISFEDFQERLKDQGVQATLRGKNITYEHLESNKKVRGTKLGLAYEKETILHGFERQVTRERETTSSAERGVTTVTAVIPRDDSTSKSDRGLSLDVPERKHEQEMMIEQELKEIKKTSQDVQREWELTSMTLLSKLENDIETHKLHTNKTLAEMKTAIKVLHSEMKKNQEFLNNEFQTNNQVIKDEHEKINNNL
ncbi:relaxase/mobilization nuclease domain-containing protein, partial [Bacillus megaterium]|nr:relaxase/mobilization nuclease domain-containing protein [Priestia megaterium]